MATRTISGSRAVVTGASGGIGRAIAVELARQGCEVIAVARREERLRELAAEVAALGRRLEFIAGDITDPGARRAALDLAQSRWDAIDILVNNAGVGAWGPFEQASEERLRRIMEVNFFALAEMTRGALPLLKRGRRPIVVNVGSVLGYRAMPRSSEYCASKFAVRGLSQALRPELASSGIDLLLVSPSTTDTEFFDRPLEAQGVPSWPGRPRTPAAVVARQTVSAIRRGRHEIVISLGGKLLVWANRFFPRVTDYVMGRIG
ncbi:MAG: SDR family NAD(P)-dependent oxidoreductase [Planctomycetes bacterium]|nr:SDR family NAD(P)-dependent oxidoreductase [Planctomycetota bacterium]